MSAAVVDCARTQVERLAAGLVVVCGHGDCERTKIERRARELVAQHWRCDVENVGVLLYRSGDGWRCSASTRGGQVYVRVTARTMADAAQVLVAEVAGALVLR